MRIAADGHDVMRRLWRDDRGTIRRDMVFRKRLGEDQPDFAFQDAQQPPRPGFGAMIVAQRIGQRLLVEDGG